MVVLHDKRESSHSHAIRANANKQNKAAPSRAHSGTSCGGRCAGPACSG